MALLGGGFSGSVLAGGSVFQFDLWNLGAQRLPVQVLVTGKRAGIMAEVGTAMAVLLVTGCKTERDMDGITSSGLDWEFFLRRRCRCRGQDGREGVQGGHERRRQENRRMGGAGIRQAACPVHRWRSGCRSGGAAIQPAADAFSLSAGAGIFYEWQTLRVLDGEIGWNYISPKWSVENRGGDVYMRMKDIPVQNGATIHLGFAVDESFQIDPDLKWTRTPSGPRIGSSSLHIECAVYGGELYQTSNPNAEPGINLSALQPIGRSETGMLSVTQTTEVEKNGKLTIYPKIFQVHQLCVLVGRRHYEGACGRPGKKIKKSRGDNGLSGLIFTVCLFGGQCRCEIAL
ncbi:hypothetical protein QW131_11420 [Roseibium salinum]|nr:hypothetical protein [Roseibium salinum]